MINEQLDGQLRMATLDPLEGKKLQVRKRDGRIIEFDETRIYLALEVALKADAGLEQDEPAPESMQADAQSVLPKASVFSPTARPPPPLPPCSRRPLTGSRAIAL